MSLNWRILSRFCTADGGYVFYALKGQMPEDEIALLPEEYQVESVVKLQVPALDGERHLVVIKANKI